MSILPPFRTADLPRLSVFVDADNISAAQATAILDLARRLGAPDLLRAYGNVCLRPEWDKVAGFQVIHSGSGKNAADMQICVDAMERALSKQCEAVLLVSSDQDFTHLATRLRERGLTVIGAGEAKTAERFRAACSEFHVFECSTPCSTQVSSPKVAPAPQKSIEPVSELDHKVREIIDENDKDGSGLKIQTLGSLMSTRHGIKISTLPQKNWHSYLAKRPDLYSLDPKGPNAKVRYKPAAFKIATD